MFAPEPPNPEQEELQRLFNEGSEELQTIFKELALKEGWPPEIVGQVRVKMNPDGVNLEYDNILEDQIFDLEYGKLGQPPAAALRKLKEVAAEKLLQTQLKQAFQVLRQKGPF